MTSFQKKTFLEAFNKAFDEYGGDEHRAFAVAHHAAQQAGKRERDKEPSPRRSR
jgi:cation transport regulator